MPLTSRISINENNQNYRKHKKALIKEVQKALEDWKPVKHEFSPKYYQVIDFFSGCGGMTLGFEAVSKVIPFFKTIGGCDINPDASKSYEKNFGVPGIVQDVTKLIDKNELNKFLIKLPEYKKNKPLIVIGCPPCQGFTSHRKKNWSLKDNRNNLVGIFAEVAVKLNPEVIVMENVPEMLSKKYWEYFQNARDIFKKSGYIVHQQIYNAASFGVPQERYRALVIAMKKDFILPESILSKKQYITVKQAIDSLPPIKAGEVYVRDAYHYCAKHKPSTIEVIKAVPKDGGNRPKGIGPKCLDKVKGYTDVYGRLSWNKPSITITQYARNPASGRYTHPEQDRGLTIREAALLQSFPYAFEFFGSFDSIFKQIGEAVPPKLASAVAASVLIEILSQTPTNEEKANQQFYVMEPLNNSYSAYASLIEARDSRLSLL